MGGGRSNKSDESTLGRAKKSGKKATAIRAGAFELLLAYQSRTYQQQEQPLFKRSVAGVWQGFDHLTKLEVQKLK